MKKGTRSITATFLTQSHEPPTFLQIALTILDPSTDRQTLDGVRIGTKGEGMANPGKIETETVATETVRITGILGTELIVGIATTRAIGTVGIGTATQIVVTRGTDPPTTRRGDHLRHDGMISGTGRGIGRRKQRLLINDAGEIRSSLLLYYACFGCSSPTYVSIPPINRMRIHLLLGFDCDMYQQ